jgi:hypothetical protein
MIVAWRQTGGIQPLRGRRPNTRNALLFAHDCFCRFHLQIQFTLEVRGDSMIGKCIMDGDLVVLEHGMTTKGKVIMGDKSPKAVHKQSSQKQAKANADAQKKKQAAAAKQVSGKK